MAETIAPFIDQEWKIASDWDEKTDMIKIIVFQERKNGDRIVIKDGKFIRVPNGYFVESITGGPTLEIPAKNWQNFNKNGGLPKNLHNFLKTGELS